METTHICNIKKLNSIHHTIRVHFILALFLVASTSKAATGLSVDDFLHQVLLQHGLVRSLDASEQAALLQRGAGDVELAPTLSLGASYLSDRKDPNALFEYGVTESKTNQYSLGVSQKLSTGTDLSLSASLVESLNAGANVSSVSSIYIDKYSTSSLGLSLTQSLWKNFIGRSTELRHERESTSWQMQNKSYELQKRQLLLQAESAFWDYIYLQDELTLDKASLERAIKIAAWTQRRVQDGISDSADLLQAKALVAQRELQVAKNQNNLQTIQQNIRDFLEMKSDEAFPVLVGNLSQKRALLPRVSGTGKNIIDFEAHISALEAQNKQILAKESLETYKPDIKLSAAFSTNAYQPDSSKALNKITDTGKPTSSVGIAFTYIFDTDGKNSAIEQSKKEALSAQYLSERKHRDSRSAWFELEKTHLNLTQQIEAAQKISELQSQRTKAIIEKFNKGRSITTDVINAEQDAQEAAVNLAKLKAEQRKLEAKTCLYIASEE